MSVHGIKSSTKDVDVVVLPNEKYRELIAELRSAGWEYLVNDAKDRIEPQDEREQLDEMERWFHPKGNMDLFPAHCIWHRGLFFSQSMLERCTSWLTLPNLEVWLADSSTIFLLKSITGRWLQEDDRDLDDLRDILDRKPPDWAFVQREWARQVKEGLSPNAVAMAQQAVDHLRRQGYDVPWEPQERA